MLCHLFLYSWSLCFVCQIRCSGEKVAFISSIEGCRFMGTRFFFAPLQLYRLYLLGILVTHPVQLRSCTFNSRGDFFIPLARSSSGSHHFSSRLFRICFGIIYISLRSRPSRSQPLRLASGVFRTTLSILSVPKEVASDHNSAVWVLRISSIRLWLFCISFFSSIFMFFLVRRLRRFALART